MSSFFNVASYADALQGSELEIVLVMQVVFIFLPMLPLKIGDVLNVMIAFDIAGALLRWRRFDHLGHLGGEPESFVTLPITSCISSLSNVEHIFHSQC